MRWSFAALGTLLAALVLVPSPAPACVYCGNFQQVPTIRQEAATTNKDGVPFARVIVYGTIENANNGTSSELRITTVLRSDPALGDRKLLPLSKYIPSDAKNPQKYLVFADVDKDKFDTFRGVPIKSEEGVEYVKKALQLNPKDRIGNLLFYFNYLENPEKEVASDAFLEFAKGTDKEIGQVAAKLSAEKLRGWLKDPKTPAERLGLYAFMLGGCGNEEDATFLRGVLKEPSADMRKAYDGVLGGYIQLKPAEGWDLAASMLKDGKKPFEQRLLVERTIRFYYGWQPKECRTNVLKGLRAMVEQGELADVAIQDLRRWEMWDLTAEVLAVYGKKGYDGPIMRQSIVCYALCCKDDKDAARFIAARRRDSAELVKDVEESLKYDK